MGVSQEILRELLVVNEWDLRAFEDGDEDRYTKVGTHDSIVTETQNACLISVDGEEVWFPRGVLRDDVLSRVWVADWFLEKEGLL